MELYLNSPICLHGLTLLIKYRLNLKTYNLLKLITIFIIQYSPHISLLYDI
jgi:hypothetical protein